MNWFKPPVVGLERMRGHYFDDTSGQWSVASGHSACVIVWPTSDR
jgi:hypothetical protein